MKPRVYVETSVISYLTAWTSGNQQIHDQQQTTRDWWSVAQNDYELFVSQLVVEEASSGDPDAAAERLRAIEHLPVLPLVKDSNEFADSITDSGTLPEKASQDAAHIAIAVCNGLEFLVSWNMKHIANRTIEQVIHRRCEAAGYYATKLCTPTDLMESG